MEQKGRAEPPRSPAHSRRSQQALDEHTRYVERREAHENRSMLRGLLLLVLLALAASILRAGLHRAFMPGWWRPW